KGFLGSSLLVSTLVAAACTPVRSDSNSASPEAEAVGQSASAVTMNLTQYVNPFVGTSYSSSVDAEPTGWAFGNTFPGATLPFGGVQFSPDNVVVASGPRNQWNGHDVGDYDVGNPSIQDF